MSPIVPVEYDSVLLSWVSRLVGFEPGRVVEAIRSVRRWKIAHVTRSLIDQPSVDCAVATTLLAESVAFLRGQGVPETKLLSKLRRDPDVWPAWAELRAASLLARMAVPGGMISLELGGVASAQPDFVLTAVGGDPTGVEFKVIGLSDREVDFCRRIDSALDELVPAHGLLTLHASLDTTHIASHSIARSMIDQSAAKAADSCPFFPAGLAGTIVVGHGGDDAYSRRAWRRISEEVSRQLHVTGGGWAALYWNNGSDLDTLTAAVDWNELPPDLDGLIVVGDAVAFPQPSLHSFCFIFQRAAGSEGTSIYESSVDPEFAKTISDRLQHSAGVRPMVLVDQATRYQGQPLQLLRRDYRQRILPFNFLIDVDPARMAAYHAGRRRNSSDS